MSVNTNCLGNLLLRILLWLSGFATFMVLSFLPTEPESVIAFSVLFVLFFVAFSGLDIGRPFVLFSLIYLVYLIAYPVVVSYGLLPDMGNLSYVLGLHFLGYLGFSLPFVIKGGPVHISGTFILSRSFEQTLQFAYLTALLLILVYWLSIISTGQYKGEEGGGALTKIGSIINIFVFISLINISNRIFNRRKFPVSSSVLVLSICLFDILISGHRAGLVIFMISLMIVTQIRYRIFSPSRLLVVFLIGFFLFAFLKMFSSMVVNSDKQFDGSRIEQFSPAGELVEGVVLYSLYKEFKTSGRITAAAIEVAKSKSYTFTDHLRSYLRVFTPVAFRSSPGGGINRDIQAYIAENTDTGLGYSMIAEGYLLFGPLGVFANMLMLGGLLALISRRIENPIMLAVYAMAIAIACIRIRHGVASAVSMYLKSVMIPLIVLYFSHHILSLKGRIYRRVSWPSLQ